MLIDSTSDRSGSSRSRRFTISSALARRLARVRELNKEGIPLDEIRAETDMGPLLSCPCMSAAEKLLDLPSIFSPGASGRALPLVLSETACPGLGESLSTGAEWLASN